MTHAEWLRERTPPPPASLVACVEGALADDGRRDASRPEAFVDASCVLLRRVLAGPVASRAGALALLAADACITYAFEATAGDPSRVAAVAAHANHCIGQVAAAFPAPAVGKLAPARPS